MMSEGVVARFLKAATAEMIRTNQKEIRCPCRRCKLTSLMDPKADMVRDHLLVRGFMDGYRWEGDEDDYEFVHGISTRNKEGGEHHVEVPGHDQDVEDPGHDHDHNVGDHGPDDMEDQDGGPDDEDHEDEDDGPSLMDWVQDPYLQELLLKQTSNARDAAREKAKMDQLEVDAVTPLYEGCRPEDTRLKVTLMALEMKVKHKMTDTSFNDNMSFWHERLPKGNDINLYMGLLKEELATLWDAPANTWDAAAEEYFPMRAALLTTVHDFLGYGYVAGQVVHGFNACVMDGTTYRQLDRDPGSSKTVFMGHRRWLRDEDPWRKRKDLFDGQDEPRRRPRTRSGEQIDELLKNWNECPPPGKKRKAPEPLLKVWKTRSVFWDLPYWKILRVPHNLDVMHITKNVCESLLGTLLNMPERTKDGPKARYDLLSIGIREELHAGRPNDDNDDDDNDDDEAEDTQSRRKGKKAKKIEYYCPRVLHSKSEGDRAVFRLSPRSKTSLRVRGEDKQSVGVRQLRRLQEEIVVILCELEMYFPPAFFDVMVHLLVHIVEDIIQLGPTFLHNMMPFERMNGVIKGYVRNRARPDGSIAKGFLTEECISFCTSYLEIENPVGLPVNRHLGKLAGWGHRDGSREMHVDFKGRIADFERANLVALQHIDVVDPWVVEHKTFIAKTYSDQGQQRTDGDIIKEHNSTFTRWFKDKMLTYPIDEDSSAEEKLIFALSQGAEHNLMTFQA
ncbi:hypothetical protein QYE76_018357 [Lolium multiflorum]|uniref:Transposon protein, putative, CACTA, En/Spm sub-class n=1 Tax=Lolium multiflorum TaxID=4521 RepID=A0AAD8PMS1_LOLMU|nr:hypothetical protein QYE76_018357 [Lolium multiflorum]